MKVVKATECDEGIDLPIHVLTFWSNQIRNGSVVSHKPNLKSVNLLQRRRMVKECSSENARESWVKRKAILKEN